MTRERVKQLRDYAKHINFQLEGKPLGPVSLSVGVAVFPEDGTTRTAILKVVILYFIAPSTKNISGRQHPKSILDD